MRDIFLGKLTNVWCRNAGIGVDVHVHRISNRLGWVNTATKTPEGKVRFGTAETLISLVSEFSMVLPGLGGVATKGTLERDQLSFGWVWTNNLFTAGPKVWYLPCQRPMSFSSPDIGKKEAKDDRCRWHRGQWLAYYCKTRKSWRDFRVVKLVHCM
jgi:hypothetical protein